MSGHSKWASIKHKKGAADQRRGQIFSRLVKEISVAAKHGGGSVDANPRLRLALQRAKEANMPQDNIERAMKRGTGELPGVTYEELTYEGYGPGGIAILVECLTDNKKRTASDVRTVFDKRHGSMGGAGSVAWQFHKKGYILVSKSAADEDRVMSVALDAGAQDLQIEGDSYEITTESHDMEKVKKALEAVGIPMVSAEITLIPTSTVRVKGQQARDVLALVEALEDLEDVQNVYTNFDIPDEELQVS